MSAHGGSLPISQAVPARTGTVHFHLRSTKSSGLVEFAETVGSYSEGQPAGLIAGRNLPVDSPERMIAAVTAAEPDVVFVFDQFISAFRTESIPRTVIDAALTREQQRCLVIEGMDDIEALARLRRIVRVLDLEMIREPDIGDRLVVYSLRLRRSCRGFGSIKLETREDVLGNGCGARRTNQLGASEISDLLLDRVLAKAPFSYVRINHCEPRVAGLNALYHVREVSVSTRLQWGRDNLAAHDLGDVATGILRAIGNADLIGLPNINREPANNLQILENSCYVILREMTMLRHDVCVTLVNTHFRIGRLEHFYKTLARADRLILITGRNIIARLSARIGRDDIEQVRIPTEYSQAQGDETGGHFPTVYQHVLDHIRTEAGPGAVYLIGAGVLGKIYCDHVRRQGGIALDLGSLIDAWAGKVTRGTGFIPGLDLQAALPVAEQPEVLPL